MNRLLVPLLVALSASSVRGEPFDVRIAEKPDGLAVRKKILRNVIPSIDVHVESHGPFARQVALEADGLLMGIVENKERQSPFRAEIPWWPWHGNGTYTLTARADPLDPPMVRAAHTVRVEIGGMFYKTPAPRDLLVKLYRDRFGLFLTSIPVARYCARDPAESRWVSTAYIGDTLYEIQLYDDLHDVATKRPLNRAQDDPTVPSVTRPAGTYRLLVAFIDYEDSGITEREAMDALRDAAADANNRYAQFKDGVNPLLTLRAEGIFIPHRSYANRPMVDAEMLKRRAGIDMASYDLVAQVDLHAGTSVTNNGALGAAFHGYAGHGADSVNAWIQIRRPEELATHLARTLLDFEMNHTFGWLREWPCGDGSYDANNFSSDPPPWTLPAMLFGWTDLDGDGKPEIVDPTPYGLKTVPATEK